MISQIGNLQKYKKIYFDKINLKNMHSDVGIGALFDPSSGTCLWSLCCSKCFCWSNIERNWHKKKWTRFSVKNYGRWQPGSPRYLRTNRGTYRQFNRIKNWRKFMVKKIVIFDHVCGRGRCTHEIDFIFL